MKLFQVDAFAEHIFSGNPAAVVPLDTWISDGMMQKIAAENNLSETAFCVKVKNGYVIRWFTPTVEVDLCGHATLAAAHILFTEGYTSESVIQFQSKSGPLTVTREAESRLCLDFPARPPEEIDIPDGLVEALGATPLGCYKARDLIVHFENEAQVAALKPNFQAIKEVDDFAVVPTAPGDEVDFVSRFFCPNVGIDEDPVTGSAHSELTPFWAKRLSKTTMTARQISERGGSLYCTLEGNRVKIAGHCKTYLKGDLFLD